MKKSPVLLIFALIIVVSTIIPLFANFDESVKRVRDEAGLLTDEEVTKLENKISEIRKRHNFDIVLLLQNKNIPNGATSTNIADDTFDYNNYGYGEEKDGILLYINAKTRDWAISTTGYGIYAFTDAGQTYIRDELVPLMKGEKYYDAFDKFIVLVDDYVGKALKGKRYTMYNMPGTSLSLLWLAKCAGLGGLLSFLSVRTMIQRRNPVLDRLEEVLRSTIGIHKEIIYAKDVTIHSDSTTPMGTSTSTLALETRPSLERDSIFSNESSTHTSSSGTLHGGSSGKF